jgi:hypothetical protein
MASNDTIGILRRRTRPTCSRSSEASTSLPATRAFAILDGLGGPTSVDV